jgi:hypothetical protein
MADRPRSLEQQVEDLLVRMNNEPRTFALNTLMDQVRVAPNVQERLKVLEAYFNFPTEIKPDPTPETSAPQEYDPTRPGTWSPERLAEVQAVQPERHPSKPPLVTQDAPLPSRSTITVNVTGTSLFAEAVSLLVLARDADVGLVLTHAIDAFLNKLNPTEGQPNGNQ